MRAVLELKHLEQSWELINEMGKMMKKDLISINGAYEMWLLRLDISSCAENARGLLQLSNVCNS